MFPPEGALSVAAIAGTNEQASPSPSAATIGASATGRCCPVRGGPARFRGVQAIRPGSTAWSPANRRRSGRSAGPRLWRRNPRHEREPDRHGNADISLSDAYFIGGLIGQLGYDRSNSLLDPTKGFRLLARVNPEASFGNGSGFYVRDLIEGSVYYPVGEDFVIAGRARFGSISGIARDDLAPSRRFYAGGGGSVRGFGYQELGPRDPDNVPLGGRSLDEFALEGRYRFGNYGVVAFVDAGQVYEAQYPTFSSMRFGVGVGGRVYTNFGPVRSTSPRRSAAAQGESLISVYVSIGQAF